MSTVKNFAKILKDRKISLGISDEELLKGSVLSADELYDILNYDDEIFTVTPISDIERLLHNLGWEWGNLITEPSELSDRFSFSSINDLRAKSGFSIAQLSDISNIDEKNLIELDNNILSLGKWTLDFANDLADALGIKLIEIVELYSNTREDALGPLS